MNIVSISSSIGVYYKELVFLESRLGAEEKTAHLKGMVAAQRGKYDAIWRAEREIEFDIADTQAQTKTAEVRVESYMEEAYSLALHEVKQKRKDLRYSKLISMNFSTFRQQSFPVQKEDILRMKDVLELDMYDDSFRNAMNPLLDRAVVEIDRIVVLQKQLDRKRMFYRQDVDAFKNETNQVRMDVYGELIQLSDTPGESWARSFFPLQKKAKKLTEQEKAKKEEARLAKRAKKAADKLELEQKNLERARKKLDIENAKANAEKQGTGGASGGDAPADKTPADKTPADQTPAGDSEQGLVNGKGREMEVSTH